MFVVQKLEPQFPQASKTSIGHVVQLLYRASCFKVKKFLEPFVLSFRTVPWYFTLVHLPLWGGKAIHGPLYMWMELLYLTKPHEPTPLNLTMHAMTQKLTQSF